MAASVDDVTISDEDIELLSDPDPHEPKRRRRRKRGRFVKGPILMSWLRRARRLGCQVLWAAVVFQQRANMNGVKTLKLSLKKLDPDLPFSTAKWAVQKLEAAGLVRVERRNGVRLEITLLDEEEPDQS
jgi:hypothetical protein